jgi:hypothetical protein
MIVDSVTDVSWTQTFDAPTGRSYHRHQARRRATFAHPALRQDHLVQTRDEIRLTTLASCAG